MHMNSTILEIVHRTSTALALALALALDQGR